LRAFLTLLALALALTLALADCSGAVAASSCPDQTFLSYGHLAYAAIAIPESVEVPAGAAIGRGQVDEPTNSTGCRRKQLSVAIESAGSIDPRIAVHVAGRPRQLFVLGHRCDPLTGPGYWDCLLRPLTFAGRHYTASGYPLTPAPRGTLALGPAIGTTRYHGARVTVRRLVGVPPALAVGLSGEPSTAFLSPAACPYSGFANTAQDDNLLRCLQSPVWFTFDPLGTTAGGNVVARSDRPVRGAVAGARIGLVRLSVADDLVPAHHGVPIPVGHVASLVRIRIPRIAAGLYEAVVSCPRCAPQPGAGTGAGLYPAGSILVTATSKTSPGIRVVSYLLAAAFIVAAILAARTWLRRRRMRAAGGGGAAPANGRAGRGRGGRKE
jgi:hypothetical protein